MIIDLIDRAVRWNSTAPILHTTQERYDSHRENSATAYDETAKESPPND